MKHIIILGILLLASSCVLNTGAGNNTAQFVPPLVDRQWEAKHYPAEQTCIVSAGHNAIEVIMKKASTTAPMEEIVHSTRDVTPGVNLNVRVDTRSYHTADDYFTLPMSQELIRDMLNGNTAYFEWQERNSRRYGRSDRFYNMARLAQFKPKYEECKHFLGG
jgi:hypothetical protein